MEPLLSLLSIGFAFGVAGSGHCIGMCGPIAMALPVSGYSTVRQSALLGLYSLGRVLSYVLLGTLFGLAGLGVKLAGWQQFLSVIVGVVMIAGVFFSRKKHRISSIKLPWQPWVQRQFQGLMRQRGPFALFGIGFLNGLLPCGLIYTAIAGSVVAGSVQGGAVFMAGFGLGTVPALFAVAVAAKTASEHFRTVLRKWLPVFTIIVGILFILRGLGLGIPMISPPTGALQVQATEICH